MAASKLMTASEAQDRLSEAEALLRRSHEFWGCADGIGTNPEGCQVCAYFATDLDADALADLSYDRETISGG